MHNFTALDIKPNCSFLKHFIFNHNANSLVVSIWALQIKVQNVRIDIVVGRKATEAHLKLKFKDLICGL